MDSGENGCPGVAVPRPVEVDFNTGPGNVTLQFLVLVERSARGNLMI